MPPGTCTFDPERGDKLWTLSSNSQVSSSNVRILLSIPPEALTSSPGDSDAPANYFLD